MSTNAKRLAEKQREQTLSIQSRNSAKKYPGHKTLGTKAKIGYTEGDEIHHRQIAEIYRPFFAGLNEKDSRELVDWFESEGYPVGNNPRNLESMNIPMHKQLHRFAKEYGIQADSNDLRMKGGFKANNGEMARPSQPAFDNISKLSLNERMGILPMFLKYGQGAMDDELSRLNNINNRVTKNPDVLAQEFMHDKLDSLIQEIRETE